MSNAEYNTIMDAPRDSIEFRLAKILHEDHVKNLCQSLKSDSFTTEQYRQHINADLKAKFERMAAFEYPTEFARNCLNGFGVMREVEPDLWALLY